MAEIQNTQPRALVPRKLEQQENLQSLNQWRGVFRNYYRRCQYYGLFLVTGTNWDNSRYRGFTDTTETTGLKRNAATLASDLEGFLECVGSYLPFDYVSDKLKNESTNIETVWDIIYEIYDAEITTTTYLDYALMAKDPDESYRNYFNRLVGFVRQHLPKKVVTAEGVQCPAAGESLTIGLLDSIAIHWLTSIDRRLIGIIKTEFAADLKTKRLCEMIKPIAKNIDELLARYSNRDQVVTINSHEAPIKPSYATNLETSHTVDMLVRRIEQLEVDRNTRNYRNSRNMKPPPRPFYKPNKREQCKHCSFLNQHLGSNLRTDHNSQSCGKKSFSVSLIESVHYDEDPHINTLEEVDFIYDEGESKDQAKPPVLTLQNECSLSSSISETTDPPNTGCIVDNAGCVSLVASNCNYVPDTPDSNISDYYSKSSLSPTYQECLNEQLNFMPSDNADKSGTEIPPFAESTSTFVAALQKTCSSTYAWNKVDRSKSPKLLCKFHDKEFPVLIDCGAEINCIDRDFAASVNIGIIQTHTTAQAANKLPLEVCGQTLEPVVLSCKTENGVKMLYLGIMLVVANLGTKCLIGEPGKIKNNIICLPKQKLILLAEGSTVHCVPYYSEESKYTLVRAISSTTLLQDDQLSFTLPESLKNEPYVTVTPRCHSSHWLKPAVVQPSDGKIFLTNASQSQVCIQKADHLADVRDTKIYELPVQSLPCTNVHRDKFQYMDFASTRDHDIKQLEKIQVDPDKILTQDQRQIFHDIHKQFAKLFNTQPGKYNGAWGHINNNLQFATLPPPNARTHIPNYSPTMNAILAEKMDILESWGVLVKPELLDINVEFVSPSMLVPKPEKGEYRVVTDFSSLNLHLKRVPNTSATISQAKSRIAKAQYVIHLDLSNYFYQGGLQKDDCKYLGTVHPYKGLRVYACDPQGLKGASERGYEKLVRIFGDLVQNNKLAQMADGLHVLGNSIEDLVDNYLEVLKRAELCGLTFKPSKVIVCPRNITLFGWDLRGQKWFPTSHTISALVNAQRPVTVKQLRSFLGSFKQLSTSLPGYAITIHALEQVVAGRKSGEKIVWTNELDDSLTKLRHWPPILRVSLNLDRLIN